MMNRIGNIGFSTQQSTYSAQQKQKSLGFGGFIDYGNGLQPSGGANKEHMNDVIHSMESRPAEKLALVNQKELLTNQAILYSHLLKIEDKLGIQTKFEG